MRRSLRDDLDAASIADRENLMREKRYRRLVRQPDGMTRITGLLDPESSAIITTAMDAVTSPRRGGPRFVDTTRSAAPGASGLLSTTPTGDAPASRETMVECLIPTGH